MSFRSVEIKPLSDGIGLGRLGAPARKTQVKLSSVNEGEEVLPQLPKRAVVFSSVSSPKGLEGTEALAVPIPVQIPRMVYGSASVGAQLRAAPSFKARSFLGRTLVGVGSDIFVGLLTAIVFAWAGIMAWDAGAGGQINPWGALFELMTYCGQMPMFFVLGVIPAAFFLVKIARFLFGSKGSNLETHNS